MRRLLVGLLVPALVASMAVAEAFFTSDPSPSPRAEAAYQTQPIPGELTSLAEARQRVSYSLPLVKASALSNPCGSGAGPVTLLDVWASPATSESTPSERQVGMNYTHGLWVSLAPPSLYVFPDEAELPTVEQAFSPDDYPASVSTGSVRGHVAWVRQGDPAAACAAYQALSAELPGHTGPEVFCGPQELCPPPSPEPPDEGQVDSCFGLPPGGPEVACSPVVSALMYDTTFTSSIQWKESGVIIELVGPYSVTQLITLVEEQAVPEPGVDIGTGLVWF